MDTKKRLYKNTAEQKVFGVCAGIAEYFDTDVTIIRILWLCALFMGWGFLAYVACALVMPDKRDVFK